jgi:hypothetical protein
MKKALPSLVLTAVLATLLPAGAAQSVPAEADDAHNARIALHFDISKGQQPENVSMTPNGTSFVTFASARQVAKITPSLKVRVLATLPAPADGGAATPALGFALTTGIVRTADGTVYFLYASGDEDTTGLYRLRSDGSKPRLISKLPATGLPNGMAFDTTSETFYVADAVLGKIYAIGIDGGKARTWSDAKALTPNGFIGVNGVKIHNDAVWVSNLDRGTLLRIPIRDGKAGAPQVKAHGLAGIDDFEFTGYRDEVIAALVVTNEVVRISSKGKATPFVNSGDGLQSPTSVAIHDGRAHVYSAAFLTLTDPNLVVADLPGAR